MWDITDREKRGGKNEWVKSKINIIQTEGL